jgi:4-alpha-glucanotransferase
LANENGVRVIGDIPIFVAHDSADVWAHPELFLLDEEGMPTAIAGVPPDYFAATGQRWGNPLYRWDEMKEDGYQWWLDRFRAMFNLVDIVRIDHFRGIDAHWEIPADSLTAEIGRWVSGPGEEFLDAMHKGLGSLPLIAEDLGFITESVKQLRDRYDFPGMKIFQFGLEGGHDESFLPHAYPQNCVAYTGTHDNDTSRGWYEGTSEEIQDRARRYISSDGEHFAWDLIRALWASQAWTTVAPLQDFLELPTEARMNYPGTVEGNWKWRVLEDQLTDELAGRVRELNENYGR